MEDVVQPLELARPFEGEDIERLLDDAQSRLVAAGSRQIGQSGGVADVEAAVAEDDLVADVDEGGRQRARLGIGGTKEVKVSRCAVFGPIPGRRANDSISRATGSMTGLATAGRPTCPAGAARR